MAEIGDKMYCKKEKEDEWRGPGKVIGRDRKVVLVKQERKLREVTNSYHKIKRQ